MSRLDSFIRRMQAQRACIERAIELTRDLPGPVFELGLGNGRTFDHLRENCAGREIFVFERKVAAHPSCIPDPEQLFEGSLDETLTAALGRFRGRVALAHADLGSGRPAQDAEVSAFVAKHLAQLLASGAVVASDQDVGWPEAEKLPLPAPVEEGRYFLYRQR